MGEITLMLAGTPVSVRGHEGILEEVRRCFRPIITTFCTRSNPSEMLQIEREMNEWILVSRESPIIRVSNQGTFLVNFIDYISKKFLEVLPPETVVFHSAGMIAGDDLMILYGDSDAGKSTAAMRLLGPPFQLLSDEIGAVLPERTEVFPFPRPLNLSVGTRVQEPFERLCLKMAEGKEGLLVLPPVKWVCSESAEYERLHVISLNRGEDPVTLKEIKPTDGLIRLMQHCVRPKSGEQKFQTLAGMLRTNTKVHELKYREIDDAKDLLLNLTTS